MSTLAATNLKHESSATNNIVLDTSGNVGIGTTAPTQKLEVAGATASRFVVTETSTPVRAQVAANTVEAIFGSFTNHPVAFRANNTERMRIDTSGLVGIGTSSPSSTLDVVGWGQVTTSAAAGAGLRVRTPSGDGSPSIIQFTNNAASAQWGYINSPAANVLTFGGNSEYMRIDSSGNVGIGTSSPSQKLEVAGQGLFKTGTNDLIRILSDSGAIEVVRAAGDAYIDLKNTDAEDFDVRLQSVGTGGTYVLSTAGAERMRVTSGGIFLVGTTSTFDVTSGATTQLSGQCAVYNSGSPNTLMSFYNSTQSARVGFIGSNGNSTSYNSGSDYRLKENVVGIAGALGTIQGMRPVTFTWKYSPASGVFSGFIAHELQGVWPEAVSGEKDAMCSDGVTPDYQAVDQSKLVPLLIAAIQELKAEFDAYKEAHP